MIGPIVQVVLFPFCLPWYLWLGVMWVVEKLFEGWRKIRGEG